MATSDKLLAETKRLMAALLRMPPKSHGQLKVEKNPSRKRSLAKRKTVEKQ